MAVYVETVSGGGMSGGCAEAMAEYLFTTTFAAREIAFSRAKAQQEGKLERIVVKKGLVIDPELLVINGRKIPQQLNLIYVDKFNDVWKATDLVTHAQAVELAIQYVKRELNSHSSIELCD